MKMSELVTAYGDENIEFQNLDQAVTGMNWAAGKGSKVTFVTGVPIDPTTGLAKLGLVLWFDRAKIKEITGAKQ